MKGLVDSTLREGEQSPGVHFSLDDKMMITGLLDRLGIEEIELGIATPFDRELPQLIQYCRRTVSGARLSLWCRCRPVDISYAANLEPDVLSLSIPASDLHLKDKLGKSRSWALTTLTDSITLAQSLGFAVISLGLEDAFRADRDFLLDLCREAARAGTARIRLADTVGTASPAEVTALVRELCRQIPIEIGIHAHNDFGMATANGIAALEAGAHWADATVLGLGERAGNSRLEEMAGYLALKESRRPYRTEYLRPLCQKVARAAARPVPPHHPVVGEAVFTSETGLHLQGLTRNPATYEPFDPQRVGGRRRLLVGSKAGKRAVRDRLDLLGCALPEEELDGVVGLIRHQASQNRRALNDEEILAIARG